MTTFFLNNKKTILFYYGASYDNDFPLQDINHLYDADPYIGYYYHGFYDTRKTFFLNNIKESYQHAYGDYIFSEEENKIWKFTFKTGQIIYYHYDYQTELNEDKYFKEEEVKNCNNIILFLKGYLPKKVLSNNIYPDLIICDGNKCGLDKEYKNTRNMKITKLISKILMIESNSNYYIQNIYSFKLTNEELDVFILKESYKRKSSEYVIKNWHDRTDSEMKDKLYKEFKVQYFKDNPNHKALFFK